MTIIDPAIAAALGTARRVAVLTGAGVSAESGVPTFRDRLVGLWERYDPMELATPDAFDRDPALVWGWYEWRRAAILRAEPNPGHRALVTIASKVPSFMLITQNVDDLHERAGSCDVRHLHGEISRPYCETCRVSYSHPAGIPAVPEGGARVVPPRCSACGGRIRPGVVWFGERLPEGAWRGALEAARCCDIFLVCGTSSLVQPAASLVEIAREAGATTIQVNPNATDADALVSFTLRGRAGRILPQLAAETWSTAA